MSIRLDPSFREHVAASDRAVIGMWACTGNALVTEIAAGSGLDWLLIDMEHSANSLESVQSQLQVAAAYPITPVVRVPFNDQVMLKQVLDIGAQNVIVPMVSSAAEAEAAVRAVRYPPAGVRRVDDYLKDASAHTSLIVQIENTEGVDAAAEIAAVDGVDAIFVGPSDLAASMGHLGEQTHPDVLAAVAQVFAAVQAAGKPVGVNAFDPVAAESYIAHGADFVAVGADVALLARASEALAARFIPASDATGRASY